MAINGGHQLNNPCLLPKNIWTD